MLQSKLVFEATFVDTSSILGGGYLKILGILHLELNLYRQRGLQKLVFSEALYF